MQKSCKVPTSRLGRGLQYPLWPPGGALPRAGPPGLAPVGGGSQKWEKISKSRPPGLVGGCSPDCGRLVALFPGYRSTGVGPWPWFSRKSRKNDKVPRAQDGPGQVPLSPACIADSGGRCKLAKIFKVPGAQELLGWSPCSLRASLIQGVSANWRKFSKFPEPGLVLGSLPSSLRASQIVGVNANWRKFSKFPEPGEVLGSLPSSLRASSRPGIKSHFHHPVCREGASPGWAPQNRTGTLRGPPGASGAAPSL